MTQVVAYLKEFGPYAAILILVFIGRHFLERRISAGVDSRFAKRLEDHKHKLAMLSEAAQHEYRKDIAEFNLFVQKKHTVLPEVYSNFRIAHGAILNLMGLQRTPTFEEFDERDIEDYMTEHELRDGKKQEVLEHWHRDRDGAVKDLNTYLRMVKIQRARVKLDEAKNYWLLNELYMSKEANEACQKLSTNLGVYLFDVEHPPRRGEELTRTTNEQCDQALENIKQVFQWTLDRGQAPKA